MPEYNMPDGAHDEQHETGQIEDPPEPLTISIAPGILKVEKLTALRNKLADYRNHQCSIDPQEFGCPVCNDIEQIEFEIESLSDPCSACGGSGTYLGQVFYGVQPCPKCAGENYDQTVTKSSRTYAEIQQSAYGQLREKFHSILGFDIAEERDRQDKQWGGSAHDDSHGLSDWPKFITRFVRRAADAVSLSVEEPEHIEFEKHMIQVAALAVAAVQSSRRQRDAQ